jgi:hypothetical protein
MIFHSISTICSTVKTLFLKKKNADILSTPSPSHLGKSLQELLLGMAEKMAIALI